MLFPPGCLCGKGSLNYGILIQAVALTWGKGQYPTLELGTSNEIGNGNFIPDISADQYAATLANWFGVPDSALDGVCPHLANFSERHLGFLPQSDSAVSRVMPRWLRGGR